MKRDTLHKKLAHAEDLERQALRKLRLAMTLHAKWQRRVRSIQKQIVASAEQEAASARAAAGVSRPKRGIALGGDA